MTSVEIAMAVPKRGGVRLQARIIAFWADLEVPDTASARILANGVQIVAFGPSSQHRWVQQGPMLVNLMSLNSTMITVEVTTQSSSWLFHKNVVATCQFLFWDLLEEDIPLTDELFTSNNELLGQAYLHMDVDMAPLMGLVTQEKEQKQPAPTFGTLLNTIIMLQSSLTLHPSLPRLVDVHLRLLWMRLKRDWPNQLEQAAKSGINASDLRDNAVEDLLTLVHDQVELLMHIAPFVHSGSLGTTNIFHLVRMLIYCVATVYAWSEYYVCNSYATVEIYGGQYAPKMFKHLQQELLFRRLDVLVEHRRENVVFRQPDYISILYSRAIMEFRAREDWKWSSYTAAFGCLRNQDANEAFRIILYNLAAYKDVSDTKFRDFLRRLMAHTMHFARQPPGNLDIGRVDLTLPAGATEDVPPQPVGHGSYGIVYRGSYIPHGSFHSEEVAVKFLGSAQTRKEKLYPEIINYYTLNHPNVLHLKGISYWTGRLSLVFPWMHNGTIVRYMQKLKYERTPGLEAKAIVWMHEIANGMSYIHREGIIHGDLRGSNVLVSREGRACIGDFGLSVYANGHSGNYNSTRQGNDGWTAPELQQPTGRSSRPTERSDIFSFAMLCLEIYTGQDPWEPTGLDGKARGRRLCDGERPPCPSSPDGFGMMPSDLWALIKDCWAQNPDQRPEVHQILSRLELLL